MNWLDFLIIITLGYQGVKGLKRGFIKIFFELIGLVIGFIVGLEHYPKLAIIFKDIFGLKEIYATLSSIAIIFITILIIIKLLSNLLDKVISFSGLGLINHLGGLGLGLIKGAIIIMPIIAPLFFLEASAIKNSTLITPMTPIIKNIITRYIPLPKPTTPSSSSTKNDA